MTPYGEKRPTASQLQKDIAWSGAFAAHARTCQLYHIHPSNQRSVPGFRRLAGIKLAKRHFARVLL